MPQYRITFPALDLTLPALDLTHNNRFLKDEDLGFIAEPHVSRVEEVPEPHTSFMIVASDGLWDVLSEERAASLVFKVRAAQFGMKAGGGFPYLCAWFDLYVSGLYCMLFPQSKAFHDDPEGTNAELVADIMLSQAITLRSGDDITVMVVERRRPKT